MPTLAGHLSLADMLSEVTGEAWTYFRKNFRGGYVDKWRHSPVSVCKVGGELSFGPPPGEYRVEVWKDGAYVLVGDSPDINGVLSLVMEALV